jgi:hypothetical protein
MALTDTKNVDKGSFLLGQDPDPTKKGPDPTGSATLITSHYIAISPNWLLALSAPQISIQYKARIQKEGLFCGKAWYSPNTFVWFVRVVGGSGPARLHSI